jgi:hypothetical protein
MEAILAAKRFVVVAIRSKPLIKQSILVFSIELMSSGIMIFWGSLPG